MMGIDLYNYTALTQIRQITAELLSEYTTEQIIEAGWNVIVVLSNFNKDHPDKIPTKPGSGLLNIGPVRVDDFALALHLVGSNYPAMMKVIERAKGLPPLIAYLEVRANSSVLRPTNSIVDSALGYAISSMKFDGDVAKLWNQDLKKDVTRLWPLARTGQNHSVEQAKRRMGKTKLNESQKRQIIREHEAALVKYGAIKSLARKFDVSDDTIKRVLDSQVTQKETKQD